MSAAKTQKLFSDLGIGLGLRATHYTDVLNKDEKGGRSNISWFEALSENYMEDGGRPVQKLLQVRRERQINLHGVSLSIASTDPIDQDYIRRLKLLIEKVEPSIVSDHCCWTGFNGQNLHDLMPVPFTKEAVDHISRRVIEVQERLGRRILLENVSSYVTFSDSEMTEWEFLTELSNKADCGILLDVNNVYVSSVNHKFNPIDYIKGVPLHRVGQIHLAGHSERVSENGTRYLIDTHDHAVCDEVWKLYEQTIRLTGAVSTMVEWDAKIPEYTRLEEEVMKAGKIREQVLK